MSGDLDKTTSLLGRQMTVEQWGDLPEDQEGELVDGVLVAEEQVTTDHELLRAGFLVEVEVWARNNRAFAGAGDTFKLRITARRGRKPDAFVYLAGQPRPGLRDPLVSEPPSIVIEIISRSRGDVRRDRIEKMVDYAKAKVPWYWLVDPDARTVEIWELGRDGRYAFATGGGEGKLEPIPGCAGLVLDLDLLWKRLDDFGAEPAPR
jgi:Uma2 family endonuclease